MAGVAAAAGAASGAGGAGAHGGGIVDWTRLGGHGRDHVGGAGEGVGEGGWFGEDVGHGEGAVAEGVVDGG